jgi:hypothetical protein
MIALDLAENNKEVIAEILNRLHIIINRTYPKIKL